MSLLPLALSAHASAWNPAGVPGPGGGPVAKPEAPCRFCGLGTARWSEWFHLSGNHDDNAPANIVPACPLCHLCQHLERPYIGLEAALIWLPDLSQAAVVTIARQVHLTLHAHGEPAHVERGRPMRHAASLYPAWAAFEALRARAALAQDRLGIASPRDLAAALVGLSPHARPFSEALLRGLRLLPLGRLFQEREDIYPQILADWAEAPDIDPSHVSCPEGRQRPPRDVDGDSSVSAAGPI